MRTSHKLTQIFLGLTALVSLAAMSFAQVPTVGTVSAGNNDIQVSDQKPGSILVFPYYTSNAQTKSDTRLTITNLAGTNNSPLPAVPPPGVAGTVVVHLFFLNGANCQQADMFVCLTKGAQVVFKASEQDPEITGYLVAVAVNAMGQPISWNALIGNAFVATDTVKGNYGAESFAAIGTAFGAVMTDRQVAPADPNLFSLGLDGVAGGYDRAADQFAVEIQNPNASGAAGQTIVHVATAGNISTGVMSTVAQSGTGLVIKDDEKQGSFVGFIGGVCQSRNVITTTNPRVPTGLGVFLGTGSGTLVYATQNPSVGVLLTPTANAWSGIRTLHKTRTRAGNLIIPVFMPVC